MSRTPPISESPIFLAESTLGKLAKWLRLAGVDTLLDAAAPDPVRLAQMAGPRRRIILTRTRRVARALGSQYGLLIEGNDAMDQARQVVAHFRIERHQLRPMSRCASCNTLLSEVQKTEIAAQVPDHVLEEHDRFLQCMQCRRIFWPGTHAVRITSVIDGWYGP